MFVFDIFYLLLLLKLTEALILGVLCRPVVSRRLLVLQCLHTLHVGGFWGNTRTAAAAEHGRDPEDGQQALYDPGMSYPSSPVFAFYWYSSTGTKNSHEIVWFYGILLCIQ